MSYCLAHAELKRESERSFVMHMKKQIASKKEKQDKRIQKYHQNYYYLKGESWCPVYIKKTFY